MKIRIKGNSLRLRLSQSEIQLLKEEGRVTDSISFAPDRSLSYLLESSDRIQRAEATYFNDQIRVILPGQTAAQWINTDQVSITAEQNMNATDCLSILIEKDFRCLTERPNENEADLFPHPKEGRLNC